MRLLPAIAIALLIAAPTARSEDAAPQPPPADAPEVNPLASNGDYLLHHPDLGDRKIAMEAYKRGDYDYAVRAFRWAARYADKPSQAMLASMYWDGKGVPQDHALGYAWMDLAAERAYPNLLAFRERYWRELTDDERKRALEVGQSLYDEYADAVAKPRLEMQMRRGLREVTGSHAGFVGTMQIQIPSFSGNPQYIDANQYYDPHFWKPKQYWAWADRAWKTPKGVVHVGKLENLPDAKPAKTSNPEDDANDKH